MNLRLLVPALVLVSVSGCAMPFRGRAQRLQWTVRGEQRGVEGGADATAPTLQFAAQEIWWVGRDGLVIESRMEQASAGTTEHKSWVLPKEGWVYEMDLKDGRGTPVPYARWSEERLRSSRAALLDTLTAIDGQDRYQRFIGDLRLKETPDSLLISIQPGRLWRATGHAPGLVDWTLPMMPMGFAGLPLASSFALGELLDDFQPDRVEVLALPIEERAVVITHRLLDVEGVDSSALEDGFPKAAVQKLLQRETAWGDKEILWRLLHDDEVRPEGLDRRGVRIRLEPLIDAEDRHRIKQAMNEAADLESLEELAHLYYRAGPARFLDWLEQQSSQGRLLDVVAGLSVLSLKEPAEVGDILESWFDPDGERWKDIPESEAAESMAWLRAVGFWVEYGPWAHQRTALNEEIQ